MAVLRRVTLADNGTILVRETSTFVKFALDERMVSMPKAVYVSPRGSCIEGQLVGRGADHRACDWNYERGLG